MPPSASKNSLSPAELAQLEHAFATDPTSEAYKPLAEAYLAMGRFMEAMVVCKKGVKAHPETITARVLLARVYAEQGKDKKALEELSGALQVSPNDLPALKLSGALLCKSGDMAQGSEHLKKAIAADPKDPETVELCKKYGVAVPAPEPPPPPPQPVVVAPPPVAPVHHQQNPHAGVGAVAQPGLQTAVGQGQAYPQQPHAPQQGYPQQSMQGMPPQAHRPQQPLQQPMQQPQGGPPRVSRPAQPQPRPPVRPSRPPPSAEELEEKFGAEDSLVHRQKHSSTGLIVTVAVILIGALGLAAFFGIRKHNAEVAGKIAKLMDVMKNEIAHDSFAGYKKACDAGATIVTDLDPSLYSAHAYLAYAYAIRWGEHGEDVSDRAKEHLAKAKAAKQDHSHIQAAEAFIQFFGGDTQGAENMLSAAVEENEKNNKKSTLLMSVLGILQMHSGDLEKAQKNLKAAQTLAPADPRINAALGNVLRRQGNEFQAANAYETALRYERDHAEAQLGVTLMAIDTGKWETADKFIKKLLVADPPPSPRQLAMAHMANAIVLDEQNKTGDADKEQLIALEMDARNSELYILKARRLNRVQKTDEAIAAIREALKLDPRRASFQAELAKALMAKPGGAKEAVTAMQQAVKNMGESPKLLTLLGDCQRAAEDLDGARATYEKAVSIAKGNKWPEATLAMAYIARSKKDFAKATELFEKAKNDFMLSTRKQAECLTAQGEILEEQEKRKEALEKYKAAAGADATYGPVYWRLAKMFASETDRRQRSQAFPLCDEYLKYEPKGANAADCQKILTERPPEKK
ncbi:MAG TPA: tetratricopeptide repeat protein [Myxococcales bacterium]|jgi:tetratricopeptide (TPR) repeat protein